MRGSGAASHSARGDSAQACASNGCASATITGGPGEIAGAPASWAAMRTLCRRAALIGAPLFLTGAAAVAAASADEERPPLPQDSRADRILVVKSRHEMTLFSADTELRTYMVALARGGPAPKRREGDLLVPEGRYTIAGRNARSLFHLALRISYPEPRDVAAARTRGEPPGSDIMIHGLPNGMRLLGALHRRVDWTAGCIAVTDAEIEEIWRVVPDRTPIEIVA
jgi:murein L,D-transpeptidase YafK